MSKNSKGSATPSPRRNRGRWSGRELARLEQGWGTRSDLWFVSEFGRSKSSIEARARELFGRKPSRAGLPWSDAETSRIKQCIGIANIERMSLIARRPPAEVRAWIEHLANKDYASSGWTREESLRFRQLYGSRSDADLCVVFSRPMEDILQKARSMRLAKDKVYLKTQAVRAGSRNKMPRWTAKEIQQLIDLYPNTQNVEIAKKLDKSTTSITSKAHDLKLRKSESFLEHMGRTNVRARATRRKAGDASE